ncbi:MAG: hypothetical protein S4CHLAM102_09300 [Chlamydiia bacterium]|nr:hypothetical protein [Chlamydiia bacterium]
MSVFAVAISIFFIYNVLGNIPLYLALLGKYPVARQRMILFREMCIALVILLLFGFFGNGILNLIGISSGAVGVAGGLLLVIISLTMIFPNHDRDADSMPQHEPYVVPLAIPVMAGPGSIATVMIYSHELPDGMIAVALLLAWLPSVLIALAACQIKYLLGEKGLMALERFGGLLVALIAIQMMSIGVVNVVHDNFNVTLKKGSPVERLEQLEKEAEQKQRSTKK